MRALLLCSHYLNQPENLCMRLLTNTTKNMLLLLKGHIWITKVKGLVVNFP